MTQLVIDAMDDASKWSAFAPDGMTPSTELGLADDETYFRFGEDRTSGRLTGTATALDHTLRRALPDVDLTNFDEIRLWLRSNRVADGSPAQPFFLELCLASAASGLDDPSNVWHRYLPVSQAATWEVVRLSLDDLLPEVRGAVNLIQLRCVDASMPFTCYLDDMLAVREEMISDVDSALLARLHEQVTVDGTVVPSIIYHPENPTLPNMPYIRITHYDIQVVSERNTSAQTRGDFTATGFRLRPVSIGYDLYYEVDVYADNRQHKTQILEFVLQSLAPRSRLLVNGISLPIEWVAVEPRDLIGGQRTDRALFHFKVATRQEVGIPEPVTPPYQEIMVEVDQKVPA